MTALLTPYFFKGVYLRDLSFQGSDYDLFFPILFQFHCVPGGYSDYTMFLICVFILAHPSMIWLHFNVKPVKVFAQYQG